MSPRLRNAESQLLLVTNAEITLEILKALHYKSLSFGNPTACGLQILLDERKRQYVKAIIYEPSLYHCRTVCIYREDVPLSEDRKDWNHMHS